MMSNIIQNAMIRPVKYLILSCYGWKHRQQRRLGGLPVQWKDPHTGMWYLETTAMRILYAELLAPYKQS